MTAPTDPAADGTSEDRWSWADIAAALGVTKQTVHRKHAGRVTPGRTGSTCRRLRTLVSPAA